MDVFLFLFLLVMPFVWLPLAIRGYTSGYENYKIFFMVLFSVSCIMSATMLIAADEIILTEINLVGGEQYSSETERTYHTDYIKEVETEYVYGTGGNLTKTLTRDLVNIDDEEEINTAQWKKNWEVTVVNFVGGQWHNDCVDRSTPADQRTAPNARNDGIGVNVPQDHFFQWGFRSTYNDVLCSIAIEKTDVPFPTERGYLTVTVHMDSPGAWSVIPQSWIWINEVRYDLQKPFGWPHTFERTIVRELPHGGETDIRIEMILSDPPQRNRVNQVTLDLSMTYELIQEHHRTTLELITPEDMHIIGLYVGLLYYALGVIFVIFTISEIFRMMYRVKGSFKL